MAINACANPADWTASWQVLSAIGIFLSGMVIALAYMAGSMLGNEPLKARAKNEIYQVLATLIMVAFIGGFVAWTCSFDLSGVGVQGGGTMYDVGEEYLDWLTQSSMLVLSRMIDNAQMFGFFASIGFGIPEPGSTKVWTVGGSPFVGLGGMANAIQLLLSAQLIMVVVSVGWLALFKFISIGVMAFLFPVGVVCRCFPFTREFGGGMMALAIGFFLFFPFLFAFDWVLVGQPTDYTAGGDAEFDWFAAGQMFVEYVVINEVVMPIIEKKLKDLWKTLMDPPKAEPPPWFIKVPAWWAKLRMQVEVSLLVFDYFIQVSLMPMVTLMIGGLFLPALNGILLAAFVRDVSRFLGEEVDVSSLTRMV